MAPRLNLLPQSLSFNNAEEQALVDQIKAQRGPAGLSDLDRALLYNPSVTSAWKTFFGAIRSTSTISTVLRELAIARLGIVNNVPIEYEVHSALFLKSANGEITAPALEYIQNTPVNAHKLGQAGPGGLQPIHIAVIAYTDAVCRDIRVPEEVYGEVKKWFGEREIVDLTVLVAAYNSVTRIVVPLQLFGIEY